MNKTTAFRYILGLICFLQIDFMFWTGAWSSDPNWPYNLWVDLQAYGIVLLQINVYNSFCIFGTGLIIALCSDFIIGIFRGIYEWSKR